MIATIINVITVIIGSLAGFFLHSKIKDDFKTVVYDGVGLICIILGITMGLEGTKILYIALSIVIGGLLGTFLKIEDQVLKLGEVLKKVFKVKESGDHNAAFAFLNASVLFCVGPITLLGSFQAGVQGDYSLILTKSVMDGFLAILLSAAMGIGTIFSALTILIYQGGMTLLAVLVSPYVSDLVLSEISGIGGLLIIMIGLNLLHLKNIKTANYTPAFLVIIIFVALDPMINGLLGI